MLRYDVTKSGEEEVCLRLLGTMRDDVWTERLLESLAEHYINDGVRHIIVDVQGVSFIDLEGVATLLRLAQEARQHAKRLTIGGASGQVREKLEVTGVLGYLQGEGADASGGGAWQTTNDWR